MEERRGVELILTEMGKLLSAKTSEVAQLILVKGLAELSDKQYSCVEEGMKQMVRTLHTSQ